jgi:hypothetical protein
MSMAQRKMPVDEGYPGTIDQPNSARGYVSLRLVSTAKVDYLDGGGKNIWADK